jgi:hypothetical protein
MVISNIEGKICFVLRMLLHAGCQQCCLIDLITGGLISKPKKGCQLLIRRKAMSKCVFCSFTFRSNPIVVPILN